MPWHIAQNGGDLCRIRRRCFKAGAMDFDLLLRTNELLNRFLTCWQNTKTGFAIYWWMSIKIPIILSTSLFARFPTSFKTFVLLVMMRKVSMLFGEQTLTIF